MIGLFPLIGFDVKKIKGGINMNYFDSLVGDGGLEFFIPMILKGSVL